MEIPVTLVPSIDAQAWPNEIYVGYATGWMRRYDQEFDPDRSTSGRLPPTGRENPAQQKTIVLADDRRMADRAMKSCDRVLNALAILDDDPQRFAVLINALTADQTEWRQRYDDNRRANKRVSVKSDVVGRSTFGRLLPTGRKNHLYQTARDWTWARLIEDGKALLAIDPDQPARILSTDKKAQKAGGLCLALKGVLVKPTDDVDVEKEYRLVTFEELEKL